MDYRLYTSPWKAVRLLLLSSVFVVPSILFLIYGDGSDTWIWWMSICFFGLGYPLGLYKLFDKRPQIIVNEVGIYDRTVLKEFINWELIQDAYISEVHKIYFISLVMKDGVNLHGIVNDNAAALNKSLGFQELNINLASVQIDVQKLAEFIVAMKDADTAHRGDLIKQLNASN